ncbi:aldo/keto reductase [Victivallis vadensis]|uniref:Diketogulonate reductase-like aldo/keto reductase n=1 Tax=Victivallis vadensis TaxID=172901 RepID=A0A2U1BAX3_9BACT|nr:aldo/keto reductase [Victivallis vadensis]PVY45813.1 diketogulonate reductase-like aldo/keto reductase [Victivallis vadensis]
MSDVPWKSLKNGFAIPVLGQGTWRMGGVDTPDTANDDADIAAIRRGIATGLCHIDTAEMYAGGHAEELVGIAMKGQGIRRADYFLTDKVWKTHLRYDDVLRAAEASLKRLGTDYIDLYLIHQVNPDVPEEETIRAMNRLKREGVIRHIGVSNFSEERLKRAQAASDAPIVANQLHYNLRIREIEQCGLLDYCRSQDIMVIAWRPLRGLDLALPLIVTLAEKYGKTPSQIALNWLLCQENVVTITKAANPLHLAENMGALGWVLEKEDAERLRREYPAEAVSDAVPLI